MALEKSPLAYTLVIDEQRQDLLTAILAAATLEPKLFAFIAKKNLGECMLSMLKEIADNTHERGWCKDPRCPDHK